ncbi:hypothetical protein [Stutzerimonas nitrititolerans]|uniref:hypothetical protein n=1 Tax=Stutzerimonas nitrititolerans TaxID=2482751 RepID=UPI0028B094DF|nr:hypothetical protein [Stutzerimonas nitrititolerans]
MEETEFFDGPQVLRELHLAGGCRALNGMDQYVELDTATLNGKSVKIRFEKFGALYAEVKKLRIPIVGCDFFLTQEQASGLLPPEWRVTSVSGPQWLCADQGHNWSFIQNSAFEEKNGVLCDLASRLSHQIRACEWRVRELSNCYAKQLASSIPRNYKESSLFLDGNTAQCYMAFQSFLIDACILRDYFCEFYAATILEKDIASIGGLINHFKKNPPDDSAGKELHASAINGQWLCELGAYRNLVVHAAPLSQAGESLYAVARHFPLPEGEKLPAVKLPIPKNPSSLRDARNNGGYFENVDFARFSNSVKDVENCNDALEYSHLCMQLLGALSGSIAKVSPLKPTIPIAKPLPGTLKITPIGE